MSFVRAARAALAHQNARKQLSAAVAVALIGVFVSCGSSRHSSSTPNHNAYVTLPANGSVALLHINGSTGAMSVAFQTPQVQGTSPRGLALLPSKKFLYAVNSAANTISTFSVAGDGTLSLSRTPIAAGSGAYQAVIDPSGAFLLVTNNFANTVSVFAIDAGSGALTEVPGSPFYANPDPSEILITPSGKFVYVSNPSIGMVTGFTFSNGVLAIVPNTPTFSGAGAFGLAVDPGSKYLYVANPAALNPNVPATTGNISGFNIDPNTGALTPILGSPFTQSLGSGPTEIAVDPNGRFVYTAASGTSSSVWGFTISSTGQLVPVPNSPFSLSAGIAFALIDPSGNYLYIGSATGNGVAAFTYNSSTGVPTAIAGSPFSTGSPPGKMVLAE